jgi:hypothetical protein
MDVLGKIIRTYDVLLSRKFEKLSVKKSGSRSHQVL